MQRRSFLGAMLAACAGPAIVKSGVLMPVRSLVLPEAFTEAQFPLVIELGRPRLTASDITREALRVLNDNLNFVANLNREWEASPGSRIAIRKPQRYVTNSTCRTVPT